MQRSPSASSPVDAAHGTNAKQLDEVRGSDNQFATLRPASPDVTFKLRIMRGFHALIRIGKLE